MVTRVGALTTRLLLSNSHSLSAWSASVRFLKGPSTGPLIGPISLKSASTRPSSPA
jgi:hypothetical protein